MLTFFMVFMLVLMLAGLWAYFTTPRYPTFRRTQPTQSFEPDISVSVNVPVTGVTWVSRPPQTTVIEEEEIFVDSPIDPLDLMMDALATDEIIEEGPMVIESGLGYGADAVDNSYGSDVVEVEDDDDIDYDYGM